MGSGKSKNIQKEHRLRVTPKKQADFSQFPARVDKVNIAGLSRTHDDYVQKTAKYIFKANNLLDVFLTTEKARQYLLELGIFKNVRAHIDVSKGEGASPNGYEITFNGTELSSTEGGIDTEIGQNEGSVRVQLSRPNILGRGELLNLSGTYSNSKSVNVSLKLSKPFYHTILGDNKPIISCMLFRHSNTVPLSSYKAKTIGCIADLSFLTLFPLKINHCIQYELSFGKTLMLGKHTPLFVREYCGPKMLSLIRYDLQIDAQNYFRFPPKGFNLRSTNEICGLGGNIQYIMTNTHAEICKPLFAGISLQLCSNIGYLLSSKESPKVPISKLFTLGGPLTLRGFQTSGVSPISNGYVVGTNGFWSFGVHLWSPIPFSRHGRINDVVRSHLFYNLGGCDFNYENRRSAAGLGIAIRLGDKCRMEFNYCYPIDKKLNDRVCNSFQFGIGYEFI